LSSIEEDDFETIDSLNIINNTSFKDINDIKNSQNPIIFTTFHLGSYRMLNSFLAKHGFNSTLIVDEEVYLGQKESFLKSWEKVDNHYRNSSSFTVLNAEKRSIILTLMRQIKNNNTVLVVYLDGNTGTGKKLNKNPNLKTINFLKNEMCVRKGFAFLSNILKATVIPVLSYRENEKNNLHFFKEMVSDSNISKDESINQIINYNFSNFERFLLKFPEQWEGWFYMHKWFDLNRYEKQPYNETDVIKGKMNFERYMPFKYCIDQYFIFDKTNYSSCPISKELYNNLWNNNIELIDSEIKNKLITINVII
jgi:KDO2-lipid IV(A) lauroyltransferase